MAHSQTKLTAGEARKIAVSILASRFKEYGFDKVAVEEEEDFDGENILRMVVHVRKSVPADELVDAIDDIRLALIKQGDDRFVYLSTELPGEDEIEEDVEE